MSWEIRQGDALALLREMPDASVDAIVTDPPYALGFMGKAWDSSLPGVEFWAEALRVAKPGAHVVAFGGSRTYHRLACAIEDAGWEVRDCLMWLYGSGFPKSLDVSKAIDKADGHWRVRANGITSGNGAMAGPNYGRTDKGDPVTPEAAAWQGWGTALKPAHEPIILARKPLAGTVAANVLEHGTGALNVDGCRVAAASGSPAEARRATARRTGNAPVSIRSAAEASADGRIENRARPEVYMAARPGESIGRWPANVLLDSEAAEALDEQSGITASNPNPNPNPNYKNAVFGRGMGGVVSGANQHADIGGASRFFFVSGGDRCVNCGSARSAETSSNQPRHPGSSAPSDAPTPPGSEPSRAGQASIDGFVNSTQLRGHASAAAPTDSTDTTRTMPTSCASCGSALPATEGSTSPDTAARVAVGNDRVAGTRFWYSAKASASERHAQGRNAHPTVKPVDLMRWLCRLVTPRGGLVLDPFTGSGSTGVAALAEGFRFLGFEREADYCATARRRIAGPLFAEATA